MATEKQKNAMKNFVENRGNASKAMRDAGYADKTAKNPKNLTQSKSWKELIDKHFPEDMVAEEIGKLFNMTKIESFIIPNDPTDEMIKEIKESVKKSGCTFRSIQKTMKGTFCYYFAPDSAAKAKAADIAVKIRGTYASDKNAEKLIDKIESITFEFPKP